MCRRACLTTVIRRELVLSTWYGRRHQFKVKCYTVIKQLSCGKRRSFGRGKKIRIAYSTEYSQAVTHPSTNSAQSCLTTVIRRELVHSTWYGSRHISCVEELFFVNELFDISMHIKASCMLSPIDVSVKEQYFA